MPRCHTCGGYVTDNYVHVFATVDTDAIDACPNCEHDRRST